MNSFLRIWLPIGVFAAALILLLVWIWRPQTDRTDPSAHDSRLVQHEVPDLPPDLDRFDQETVDLITRAHAHLRRAPDDARRWNELGMVYHANDYFDRSAVCYRAAVAIDAELPRTWYLLSLVEYRLAHYAEAELALQEVLARDGEYAPVHWRLGEMMIEVGRFDEAEAAFIRATELSADKAAGWLGLARVYLGLRQDERAVAVLEEWIAKSNNNYGYANHLLATAYRRLGRDDDAGTALRRSGDPEPVWRDRWKEDLDEFRQGHGARKNRAKALVAAGRYDEAIELLESMRRNQPDNTTVLTNLGMAHRHRRNVRESFRYLELALEIDDNFYVAHFQLAVGYLLVSQARGVQNPGEIRASAMRHVERVLELNPTYAPAHSLKGDLLGVENRHHDALVAHREAARCAPDDARWPFHVGLTLMHMQRWEEAVIELELSVDMDPTDSEIFRALALARMSVGRLDLAEDALDRADVLSPNDPRLATARKRLVTLRSGGH